MRSGKDIGTSGNGGSGKSGISGRGDFLAGRMPSHRRMMIRSSIVMRGRMADGARTLGAVRDRSLSSAVAVETRVTMRSGGGVLPVPILSVPFPMNTLAHTPPTLHARAPLLLQKPLKRPSRKLLQYTTPRGPRFLSLVAARKRSVR